MGLKRGVGPGSHAVDRLAHQHKLLQEKNRVTSCTMARAAKASHDISSTFIEAADESSYVPNVRESSAILVSTDGVRLKPSKQLHGDFKKSTSLVTLVSTPALSHKK